MSACCRTLPVLARSIRLTAYLRFILHKLICVIRLSISCSACSQGKAQYQRNASSPPPVSFPVFCPGNVAVAKIPFCKRTGGHIGDPQFFAEWKIGSLILPCHEGIHIFNGGYFTYCVGSPNIILWCEGNPHARIFPAFISSAMVSATSSGSVFGSMRCW